jgi:Protein of unknown function (DUF3224)
MTEVSGAIIVDKRTVLYTFTAGAETITYLHAAATYSGDLAGPADETFVAVDHVDGTQTHYGWGSFTGLVAGREGTLLWKFKGKPGSGDIEIYDGSGEMGGLRGAIGYRVVEGSEEHFTYQGTIG